MNEWVLREVGRLHCQSVVTGGQTLVVHEREFLPRLLLLPDLVLEFGHVEHECVNLGGPLDEDFALQVRAEGGPLVLHAHLKLFVGHSAPGFKETVHFLPIQGVAHVGSLASLALIDTEVEPPCLHNGLQSELV